MEDIRIRQVRKYIEVRQAMLEEERERASDAHDREWYTRLIRELDQVKFWVEERRREKS